MKEFSNFHDGAIDNHGEFRGHPNMSSSNTDTERVCYKDKSQFSEEFFVYCEFGMTELYRKGTLGFDFQARRLSLRLFKRTMFTFVNLEVKREKQSCLQIKCLSIFI